MPFLYILLGLAALLVLLLLAVLFLPLYARIGYNGELTVKLWVLGIPIPLLPDTFAEEKKPKKQAKPPARKPSKAQQLKQELSSSFSRDGVQATLDYLGKLAAIVGKAVGRLLRAVTVDKLQLEICVATGEPADTAVRYGQVCFALYPALTAISGAVRIHHRQLRVEPNFLLENGGVYADIRLHVWMFRVAGAAITLLWRYMMLNDDISTDHKEVMTNGK